MNFLLQQLAVSVCQFVASIAGDRDIYFTGCVLASWSLHHAAVEDKVTPLVSLL